MTAVLYVMVGVSAFGITAALLGLPKDPVRQAMRPRQSPFRSINIVALVALELVATGVVWAALLT